MAYPRIDQTTHAYLASWALLCVVSFSINFTVWREVVRRWSDLGAYAHGPLVLALFVWGSFHVFRKQSGGRCIGTASRESMILAAIVLFLLAVVGKVFQEARFEAAAELLLPLSVACCAFCLFDRKTAASLASVSALLLFSVAIWDTLSIPLRDLTVLITSSVVSLAGWPALITGADIILPDGTVRIEEGCSGLKYFVAASCLGYFSAIINNLNSLKTFVVVLVFIAAALLGNWLRVTLLVAVAHYTELQSPLLESHNSFGWVLFGVLLIPTILICDRINGTGDKGPESTSG